MKKKCGRKYQYIKKLGEKIYYKIKKKKTCCVKDF